MEKTKNPVCYADRFIRELVSKQKLPADLTTLMSSGRLYSKKAVNLEKWEKFKRLLKITNKIGVED